MLPALTPAQLQFLAQNATLLLWAWLLGGAIGLQRQLRGHAAGLRTHTLVCGAACLLAIVSFSGRADDGHIAAQIVSGVGFLGAGVILRRGVSVQGLTTAASVWLVAGVGIAVGAGVPFAILATMTTVLTLLTLVGAKPLEKRLAHRSADRLGESSATLNINVPSGGADLARALQALTATDGRIASVETDVVEGQEDADNQCVSARITLRAKKGNMDRDRRSAELVKAVPGISYEWDDGTKGGDMTAD
jgi:putative Mg2+ transporter-C (MgtC) family protein